MTPPKDPTPTERHSNPAPEQVNDPVLGTSDEQLRIFFAGQYARAQAPAASLPPDLSRLFANLDSVFTGPPDDQSELIQEIDLTDEALDDFFMDLNLYRWTIQDATLTHLDNGVVSTTRSATYDLDCVDTTAQVETRQTPHAAGFTIMYHSVPVGVVLQLNGTPRPELTNGPVVVTLTHADGNQSIATAELVPFSPQELFIPTPHSCPITHITITPGTHSSK